MTLSNLLVRSTWELEREAGPGGEIEAPGGRSMMKQIREGRRRNSAQKSKKRGRCRLLAVPNSPKLPGSVRATFGIACRIKELRGAVQHRRP